MHTKYSLYVPIAVNRETEMFDVAQGYVLFGFGPIFSKKTV